MLTSLSATSSVVSTVTQTYMATQSISSFNNHENYNVQILKQASTPTVTPDPLNPSVPEQGIWRRPYTASTYSLPYCSPVTIPPGTFVLHGGTTVTVKHPSTAVFYPRCINGRPALMSGKLTKSFSESIIKDRTQEWMKWISQSGGRFATSVIPLIYALSASAIFCWFITLLIMAFQFNRRSGLYKIALLCCSTYLSMMIFQFSITLRKQYVHGYIDAVEARYIVRVKPKAHAINLAFSTILYMAQVQIAMSLFARQKEKRMVLWLGGALIIVGQSIYGISVFNEDTSTLQTFAYLFQISLGILYTCCVINKGRWTFDTLIAVLAASSPIVIFVVDLANVWIFEWTDALAWVAYALAIVVVKEWDERVDGQERRREMNGVLGKQFFEEDDTINKKSGKWRSNFIVKNCYKIFKSINKISDWVIKLGEPSVPVDSFCEGYSKQSQETELSVTDTNLTSLQRFYHPMK